MNTNILSLSLVSLCIFNITATTEHNLVDVQSICPTIQKEIWYATEHNFTQHEVYPADYCFLHKDTVRQLINVQEELSHLGLGLKIWDGFRPVFAQRRFWELVPDPRYVSDPAKGGRHTRGTAVDCTLIYLADESELEIPTKFDNLTERAHRSYIMLPQEALDNRQLLEDIMHKYGFTGIQTEWWHFDLDGWNKKDSDGNDLYPVIKLDFHEL